MPDPQPPNKPLDENITTLHSPPRDTTKLVDLWRWNKPASCFLKPDIFQVDALCKQHLLHHPDLNRKPGTPDEIALQKILLALSPPNEQDSEQIKVETELPTTADFAIAMRLLRSIQLSADRIRAEGKEHIPTLSLVNFTLEILLEQYANLPADQQKEIDDMLGLPKQPEVIDPIFDLVEGVNPVIITPIAIGEPDKQAFIYSYQVEIDGKMQNLYLDKDFTKRKMSADQIRELILKTISRRDKEQIAFDELTSDNKEELIRCFRILSTPARDDASRQAVNAIPETTLELINIYSIYLTQMHLAEQAEQAKKQQNIT